jgi:hypothetical protein
MEATPLAPALALRPSISGGRIPSKFYVPARFVATMRRMPGLLGLALLDFRHRLAFFTAASGPIPKFASARGTFRANFGI